MNKLLQVSFFILLPFFAYSGIYSSDAIDADTMKVLSKHKSPGLKYFGKQGLKNFGITGNYRGMIYYRNMDELFDGSYSEEKMLLSTNDGGRQAQLELDIVARPTANTSFRTDFYLYSPMLGSGYNDNETGLQMGVNLDGQMNYEHVKISFRLGGLQYTRISKLTLSATEDEGESLFERNSWDHFQTAAQNYESYYGQGTIIRDFRWGNQFCQGLVASAYDMPWGLEARLLYAKTPNNGGQTSYLDTIPNISYGGFVHKRFGQNYIGINTFNSVSYDTTVNGNFIGYNIGSLDFSLDFFKDFNITGEFGYGRYVEDETLEKSYGEALDVVLLSRQKIIGSPLKLHMYRLSPSFINLDGGFNTFLSTTAGYNGEGGSSYPVGANMSDVDYLNGNRQGLDLRAELNLAGLKVNLATGFSEEVEHLSSSVSFGHRINGIMFARVFGYQNYMGPYSALTTNYRSYYETNPLDTSKIDSKIRFAVTEWNLKYKFNVANRPVYLFYLGSYASSQEKLSPLPVLKEDKSYMRVQYHEFEAYYKVNSNLALASYLGFEHMKGTEGLTYAQVGANAVNEYGKAIGLGLDIVLAHLTNLYLRTRWFDFEDKNNEASHYRGFEGSLELKVNF